MESQEKFHSPQKISAASQLNGGASFSETTEFDGDLFWNVKNKKTTVKNPVKLV